MPNFLNLPPFTGEGDVHVVIETPRGSRANRQNLFIASFGAAQPQDGTFFVAFGLRI